MTDYGIYLDDNNTLSNNTVHIGNQSTQYQNSNFISDNVIHSSYAYNSDGFSYPNELVYGIQHINGGYILDVINTLPTNLTNDVSVDYGVKIDNYELTYLSNNMFCHVNTIDCFSQKEIVITLSPRTIFIVEFLNNSSFGITQKNRHDFTLFFNAGKNVYNVLCARINVYEAKKNHTYADYGIYVNDSNINSKFISNINNISVTNVESNNTEHYWKYSNTSHIRDASGKIHYVFYKKQSNKLLLNSVRILMSNGLIYDNNNLLYTCGEDSYDSIDDAYGRMWHDMPYNTVLDVQ